MLRAGLLCAFLLIAASHHVHKRSMLDLGSMLYDMTKRNPLDFNGYGNYCGLGGGGIPADHIDECCKYHDQCYDVVQKNGCDSGIGEIYILMTYYKYEIQNGMVFCAPDNSRCGQMLCVCDKKISECIASHIDEFTPANQELHLTAKS